jgi:hypothetical protein
LNLSRYSRLLLAVIGAFGLALLFLAPPSPRDTTTPAGEFSAARAMVDVRHIAQAPHPTGTPANAEVRGYLVQRLTGMGLTVRTTEAPLGDHAREELAKWGIAPVATVATDIVATMAGRDPHLPAVLVMAHYDSVAGSPGAADDGAGVASALELVRAITATGTPQRDIIVLLTDAEELGLDGARGFFAPGAAGDRDAGRVGVVVNLESRGGGGRTNMFETGPDNGAMMRLFETSVHQPTANSIGVLVYKLLPNDTDLSTTRDRKLPGFNFAFIGKPGLYHSPLATADALDQASLQHMGSQALDIVRALANLAVLPAAAPDRVFGDVFGLFMIGYPAWVGWVILAVTVGLFACAYRPLRARDKDVGGGALLMLALALHAAILLHLGNLVSGADGKINYYDRLAAIPRLEIQALAICAAVLVALTGLRPGASRIRAAFPALAVTLASLALGGVSAVWAGVGLAAMASAAALPRTRPGLAGGWIGLAAPLLLVNLAIQIVASTAGLLIDWPLALASLGAAAVAALGGRRGGLVVTLLGIVGVGFLLTFAHAIMLGVGPFQPEAAALFVPLVAVLLWPLWPEPQGRGALPLIAALLIAAFAIALWVRLDAPAASIPAYSVFK